MNFKIRLMTMFAEIGTLRHLSPSAKAVQEKIAALQKFITENYYVCTSEFVREAISVFCAH